MKGRGLDTIDGHEPALIRRCFLPERGGLGHDAFVVVIPEQCGSFVILKQVQDDEGFFLGGGEVTLPKCHFIYTIYFI